MGQEKGSLPLKSFSFFVVGFIKRISATPAPSVPGNQAATKASEALSSLLTHKGLPEIKRVTT